MAANKFLLVENFTWLLNRLSQFPGGRKDASGNVVQFNHAKMPTIKGGERRELRYGRHFSKYYNITPQGKTTVKFGSVPIECDKWHLAHNGFKDDDMGEGFPPPPDGHHTVMITSVDSMLNHTAPRYYVSCSCNDFNFVFLQKMVDAGYVSDPGNITPAKTGAGALNQEAAICKHILCVIVTEHEKSVIAEKGVEVANASVMPWASSPSIGGGFIKGFDDLADDEFDYGQEEDDTTPPVVTPAPTFSKKQDYEKLIAATLRRLNNASSDSIAAYKSPSDSAKHYRKYKFMVKWYPKGWAIVFTNPSLNPFPQGSQFKEMVPIYARTKAGLKPSPYSPIAVYSHFTKDELKALIKANSKEIQTPQITRLKGILGIKPTTPDSSWLTESLEFEASVMNTLREVL